MTSGVAVIGLNHKTAPVDIREKVTFPANIEGSITRTIQSVPGVLEAIIISTCNRSEVIARCDPVENAVHDLLNAVAHLYTGRQRRVRTGRRTGRSKRLVHQILKIRPAFLKTGRIHVSQIIGDNIQVGLLRPHACACGPQ